MLSMRIASKRALAPVSGSARRMVARRAEESPTESQPYSKGGQQLPDSPTDSLEPRVQDLKENKFKKGETDPQEIMKFDGVAPELVNGRLAMLGFAAALSAELFSHVSIFEQFKRASGPIFLAGAVILIASIIPIVRGTNVLDDGQGPEGIPGKNGIRPGFNLTNELINGRAAMFGLALLLIYEAGARGPLF